MAPAAILPDTTITTTDLVRTGIKHAIAETAPSILPHGHNSGLQELDASKLIVTRTKSPQAVPEPNSPEVWTQNVCTDHMVTCTWTSTTGWQTPYLKPYGAFSIMPTASVLHYATECFEGLKVYRGHDGRLRLFRPDRNCERMLRSATRIALPAFDPAELQKLIEALVRVDGEKWLPRSRPGRFLYLRPTMIATAPGLGVKKPAEALLYVIACCFPTMDEPTSPAALSPSSSSSSRGKTVALPGLRLLASREDTVRAWPGGFGYAKVGANYGPSLIAQAEARERGYHQVLWLLGPQNEVTEAGASNFFVVWRTREGVLQLVTAPLGDKIILDGITRRSVLQLARQRLRPTQHMGNEEGLEVVERKYTMEEVELAANEGRLMEAFAAGTAFFISAVSEIHYRGKDLDIPLSEGQSGKYASLFKIWLTNIMYGKEEHEWGLVVEETASKF